ncbi:MAG: flagellar motor switch protein FliN [bacterium]
MAEILSQNEIDALISGIGGSQVADVPASESNDLSDTEKKILEDISNTIFEACSSTLSTLLNKEVSTKEPLCKIISIQDFQEKNQKKVIVTKVDVTYDSGDDSILFVFNHNDASTIVDLMLMGEGIPKEDFTDEDIDAFKEAINQIIGTVNTSLVSKLDKKLSFSQSTVYVLDSTNPDVKLESLTKDTAIAQVTSNFTIANLINSELIQLISLPLIRDLADVVGKTTIITPKPTDTENKFSREKEPPLAMSSYPDNPDVDTENIDIILDIELPLIVRIGEADMMLQDILKLGSGSIIELNRPAESPIDLVVNNKIVARGEVVVVDANFALRITEIENPVDRIRKLG